MGKIIQTSIKGKDFIFLFDDEHKIKYIKYINNSLVDNIYKGKIVSINEGLNACFVSISNDQNVFLSLAEFNGNLPKCGDELLIQIKTDALKTKLPQGTINICIPGQYCVCHLNDTGISASKKLNKDIQDKLINIVLNENIDDINDFKWVIRTNSEALIDNSEELLFNEIREFVSIGQFLLNEARYRSLYSLVYSTKSPFLNILSDIPLEDYETIILDNKNYYNEIVDSGKFNNVTVTLYEDEYISLKNLHSLETYLDRALDKKVYLNCGGYLIIEPTEAMTVIDVNSGKFEGKKKENKSYIFKVNKEAVYEIANQLRIRNISGIIIVDFISMTNKDDNDKILSLLKEELLKDKIMTRCIDMTPLGLVEITRKKINEPLKDVFK